MYDYKLNIDKANQFLNLINGARGDPYYSSIAFNPTNDFLTRELFYLPCYGAINNQKYQAVLVNYLQLWSKYLKDICKLISKNIF